MATEQAGKLTTTIAMRPPTSPTTLMGGFSFAARPANKSNLYKIIKIYYLRNNYLIGQI
jgi:hypothetical protein